jgi:glucose-1-phosphate adenylyltransferase
MPDRSRRGLALRRGRGGRSTTASTASRRSQRRPSCARLTIPRKLSASMGIYLFNTDVLIPALLKDAKTRIPATTSAKIFCPRWWRLPRLRLRLSSTRTRKKLSTGATWARWRPTTKPTWTSSRCRRSSISTTGLAHPHPPAAVSAGEIRVRRTGTHRHGAGLHRFGRLHRLRQHGAQQRLLAGCARQLLRDVDSSILFSHVNVGRHCRIRRPSSTATCTFPKVRRSATITEADRSALFRDR